MAKTTRKRPPAAAPKRASAPAKGMSPSAKKGAQATAKSPPRKPLKTARPAAKSSPVRAKSPTTSTAKTTTKPTSKLPTKATIRRATLPRVARSSITAPDNDAPREQQPKEAVRSTTPHSAAHAVSPSTKAVPRTMSKAKRPETSSINLPEDYRPSDNEPFMGPAHRAYFKRKLANWKDEIIRETMETLQVLHDDTAQHPDLADRATSESERALELRARDRQRKLIAKIDAALKRIEDGSYGYCMESGEPIGLRRLDARPIATLSLEAQERHERRERIHRDD